MQNLTTNEMKEVLKEAIDVSINLYDQVDSYSMQTSSRVKHLALGQCLRSIVEILENENRTEPEST